MSGVTCRQGENLGQTTCDGRNLVLSEQHVELLGLGELFDHLHKLKPHASLGSTAYLLVTSIHEVNAIDLQFKNENQG